MLRIPARCWCGPSQGRLAPSLASWNIGGWVASVDLHAENVRLSYDYSSPKEGSRNAKEGGGQLNELP